MDISAEEYELVYNVDAEEALLFQALVAARQGEMETVGAILKRLHRDDFYRTRNRWCWDAVRILYHAGEPITYGNVAFLMHLESRGKVPVETAREMLTSLVQNGHFWQSAEFEFMCTDLGVETAIAYDPDDPAMWMERVQDASRKRRVLGRLMAVWDAVKEGRSPSRPLSRLQLLLGNQTRTAIDTRNHVFEIQTRGNHEAVQLNF